MSPLVPRSDFPLLAANPGLRYLDSAATSQKPAVVLDAMRAYYEHDNANPHRGAYALSARATQRYHDAREAVAGFYRMAVAAVLLIAPFGRGIAMKSLMRPGTGDHVWWMMPSAA